MSVNTAEDAEASEDRDMSDEAALWPHLREAAMKTDGSVFVGDVAETAGLETERAREIVGEWHDRGLVASLSGGFYAILTEQGRATESLAE